MKTSPSTHAHRCAAAVSCFSALAMISGAPARLSAAPATVSSLTGHIPVLASRSQAVAHLDSAQPLSLAVTLPLRDQAGLTDLLRRLYDPVDPQYGRFLTPGEFTARFGPTQADYDRVIAFAESAGLTVTGQSPNRAVLDVKGSAGQVERAFSTHLTVYQSPEDGRYFYAPDTAPAVPTSLAPIITGVVGLDNAAVWRPHSRIPTRSDRDEGPDDVMRPFLLPRETGSGPNGGLSPSDIRTAYGLSGVPQNGSGQSLGLFELANYKTSDITGYESAFGLPNVPLQNEVNVSGGGTVGRNGADEVTLDIELQIALAPGASNIYVYEAPNSDSGVVNLYNQIASDDLAEEISTSWGEDEISSGATVRNSENTAFQQMASQGQSIFAAAGDSGADDNGSSLSVDDPASQPYMVGVGGTSLATNGAGGSYKSETTWDGGSVGAGAGGGGISAVWSIPAYQAATATAASSNTASQVSTTMRNVPDVSLDADPNASGYAVFYRNGWQVYGGTSCAAPLWAAFTALVNQQRVTDGYSPIGFLNPALYSLANGRYSTDFHDIADGSTNLHYPAVSGYDDATGLGTFNGANLLADLTKSVPISGTVSLQGVQPGGLAQTLTFTITPTNTPAGARAQPVTVQTVTPSADGSFTLSGVPAGTYTLGVKGRKWLRRDVPIDTTGGSVTGLSVPLLGGDVSGHNQVSLADLAALRAAYGSHGPAASGPASPGWNPQADLTCDGQVSLADLAILRANYGKRGDR